MPSTFVLLRLLSLFWVGTLLLSCTLQVHAQDTVKGSCCKKTSPAHIKDEITKCIIHSRTNNCVDAVIFYSEKKKYCSSPKAKWVKAKLIKLEKAGTPCLGWRNNVTVMGM